MESQPSDGTSHQSGDVGVEGDNVLVIVQSIGYILILIIISQFMLVRLNSGHEDGRGSVRLDKQQSDSIQIQFQIQIPFNSIQS